MSASAVLTPSSTVLVNAMYRAGVRADEKISELAPEMVGRVHPWQGRICSSSVCMNYLEADWPSRYCRKCEERLKQQKVEVPCSSCFVTPISISQMQAKTGRRFICRPCNERRIALANANIDIAGRNGPGQSINPSGPVHVVSPFPQPFFANAQSGNLLDAARQFVHPDHRPILDRRDAPVPTIPLLPIPAAAILAAEDERRRALVRLPHYGPRGEILAVTPADVYGQRTTPAPMPTPVPVAAVPVVPEPQHIGPTSAKSIEVINLRERTPSVVSPDTSCEVSAPPKPTMDCTSRMEPSSVKADMAREHALAPNTPLHKPSKKALVPLIDRICATPDCGRAIPSQFQGTLCVNCGFTRWRTQFRAHFAGLRAELSAGGDALAANMDKENKTSASNPSDVKAIPMKASERIEPILQLERRLPYHPQPHDDQSQSTATAVDSDSSDEEPLSSKLVDPNSSDEEPLAARVAAASPDDETLAAKSKGSLTFDEEALSEAVMTRRLTSAPVFRKASGTKSKSASNADPKPQLKSLRIVIPPALKPPPLRIRRVRLIVGSKPPVSQPEPGSAGASPPERSSSQDSSTRRPSSAIDDRWHALGWNSDESELTPLAESMDEGESEIDPKESEDEAPVPATTPLTPSKTTQGARPQKHRGQCATGQCVNLLPREWKWRFCEMCRLRVRILRRQLAELQRREQRDDKDFKDISLPADGDLTAYRKCSAHNCKHLIPPVEQYQFKRCPRCRSWARRRMQILRMTKYGPPDDDEILFESPRTTFIADTSPAQVSAGNGKARFEHDNELVDLPPYQHFDALLGVFGARFEAFRAAQARYVQLKALRGVDSGPMVFTFHGEYSVVADPSGGSIDTIINSVIRSVSNGVGLAFTLVGVQTGSEDSIIVVLQCTYTSHIPTLSTEVDEADLDRSPNKVVQTEVAMTGELQICVAWDRRHQFFPGQRIMIRFRLVS